MATLTELQARLVEIRTARDAGVLLVRHGEELTQFRSLKEMNQIIASIEAEIAGKTGKRRPRVSYVVQKSKGL